MNGIEHPEVFHGLPVLTLPFLDDAGVRALPAAESVAWRLDCGPDGVTFPELWQHFPDTAGVRALLIGSWWEDEYSALAPVVAQLESLALSMGTLSDTGAVALIGGQPLPRPASLDLHHHYLTDPLMERFRELCGRSGTHLDIDEADYWDAEDDEPRHVAVSE